jgi:hypothetical protein
MPFGLCNSPATFEQAMESIPWGHTYKACLAYLDDAIVIGQTFQEQHDNLWKLFQKEAQYLAKIMLPEAVTMTQRS